MTGRLSRLLADGTVARLDGGLATELSRRGHDLDDPLWSAKLLLSDPEAVAAVHTDYLHAGADIIVSASYQASYQGLAERGLSSAQADEVFDRATRLAIDARDRFVSRTRPDRRPLVATSVGPYGATRADGSEYTGAYGLSVAELVAFHGPRLRRLAANAEFLACETIPSADEVAALAAVLAEVVPVGSPLQAWVSVSCRDDTRVCHGEPIEEALAPALALPQVAAVGVNCTHPDHVEGLVRRLAAVAGDRAIVVYPNAGEGWDAQRHTWSGSPTTPADYAEMSRRWVAAGSRIVGGCCRTTPRHIAALQQ